MKYFTYPMKTMRLTQNYNEGNHKPHNSNKTGYKDYPIDEAGVDGGRDNCYASVDMKVVKKYTEPYTNAVVLESTEKVRTPLGDKLVYMSLTHPNDDDMKKIKVGQVIKKGNVIVREGNDYPSSGNHLHITFGIAPYKGLYKNPNGCYCFTGTEVKKPEEICYVNTKFTTIKNARSISFKKVDTDSVPITSYYKKCDSKYTSIVDALNSIKVDSSFSNRKKIASKNNIKLYIGTPGQNTKMLDLLKKGKLVKV